MALYSRYLLLNQLLRIYRFFNVLIIELVLNQIVRLFFLLLFFGWIASISLWGNSSNPPNGYHGESQNCSSCHSGNLNTGNGSISLTGLPSTYTPGQTYDLALTVLGTNSRGYGFQLTPKANGSTSGNLVAVSSGMAIESGSAEHRGTSIAGSWNFQWTAPATDEGTVTFYASGLATGGSSGNDGDYVYTLSQNISANSFSHASMDWNATTGGVIFSSPAIAADGSIYIGSNDNMLHAFNADGTNKWTFETGNWVDSTPSIGPDGTIYVGSWDNKIYALNPDNGNKNWEYETNSYIVASPAIGADGKIYIGSKDSIFYAFESNGSVAWEYFAGEPVTSSAALGQDGTIYFGDENGTFHAVNPDGSGKWTYTVDTVTDTNKSILSSPALDLSGNIYFGSGNGNCYSITDNGGSASLNWSFPAFDRVDASPVLGINDEVFFVSRDGYLRSLSTLTGNLNWDAFVGDVFYSSPVVDENGRTYVIGYTGGGENHLFAFDPDGTKAWDTNQTDCPFQIGGLVDSSLALSTDGKLYYGCFDNRLYCLDVSVGPASSDWPMFQRSSRRDGAWPSYLLEVLVSPTGVATSMGQGIYNEGATVTLSLADITAGYSFNSWTGGASGNSNPLNFVISSNTSVTANFTLNQYQLAVSAGSGGSVSGSGTFDHGTTAPISATPNQGYSFSSWSGQGIASTSATTTTVSMTDNRTITASFTPRNYSIAAIASPQSSGEVSGLGNYQFGEDVTLTATPTLDGYSFVSWSGDINSTLNPLTINVDSNLSLTANFSLNTYSLTVSAGTGGSVQGTGNFLHGAVADISANPDTGYSFTGWTGDGVADPNSLNTSVYMSESRTISASFSQNSYTLVVLAGNGGSVSGDGNFTHGSLASISATPDTGYSFTGWTGDGVADTNSLNTSVDMSESRTISASFSQNSYTLVVLAGNGGSVSGDGNFTHGSLASISATPDTGYSFTGWTGDGVADTNSLNTSVDMSESRTISASFSQNSYTLVVLAGNGGSASGSGHFLHGTQASISATPQLGFSFEGWLGDGVEQNDSTTTLVSMSEPRTVTAIFKKKNYYLDLNSSLGGSVSGEGNYTYGDFVPIAAVPQDGYQFEEWSGDIEGNLTSPSRTILIDSNKSITANFIPIPENHLVLSIISNPQNGGTTTGGGSYPKNSTVSLSAVPLTGYEFLYWTGLGIEDQNSSHTQVTLKEDLSIIAHFQKKTFNLFITESEGGLTTGQDSYLFGSEANISAVANQGYRFTKWTGAGIKTPTATQTEIIITENQTISANFEIIKYQLSVPVVSGGIVTGSGLYDYGSNVEITATSLPGYSFARWLGPNLADSFSSTTQVRLTKDSNVTASFNRVVYPLTVNSTLGGLASSDGKFYYGYKASITARPSYGYSFLKWNGSGVAEPNLPFTTVSMIEERNVTAEFSVNSYQLNILNSVGGTTTGEGIYNYNSEVSITATPREGYEFSNWIGDGIEDVTSASTKVIITDDHVVTPVFKAITLSKNMEGITEIAPDWYDSSWFGTFFQNERGWAYHLEFGWIYPVITDSKNIWFWHIHLGWVWAAQESFPDRFLWSQNSQNWLLWESPTPSTIRFYDYSISDWLSFP